MIVVEAVAVGRDFRRGTEVVRAIHDVSVQIEAGDFVSISGRSGSGKSTLLHVLGALDVPTSGRILFEGRDGTSLSEADRLRLRREMVGFVFQSFHLIPHLTALENVALPLRYRGVSNAARLDRAREVLASVGLSNRLSHRPSELSGGEAQRVSLARAVVGKPRLLLADEPTGELDTATARDLGDLLVALQQHDPSCAVVVATHDEDLASRARRRLHLADGSLVE